MPVDQVKLAAFREVAKQAGLQLIVTPKEAAAFARVSDKTVRRWVGDGTVVASKSHPGKSGRVRITRESLLHKLCAV